MSLKFAIKSTIGAAEKQGEEIVRFSGISEPFEHKSERLVIETGDGLGNPKLHFTTGLDEKKVQFYKWYDDEEKKQVVKQIKEHKKLIEDYYGGPEVMDASNRYFWEKNKDVLILKVDNNTSTQFFDTARPDHALLYLSIIGGAFLDTVAPTKEWAETKRIPHYLCLENDMDDLSSEVEITRSDAHGALGWLRNEQPEALFYISWCLQYDTMGYGAYSRATPQRELVKYLISYIDGKLQLKKKRNCPKLFLEYVEKWKGQQTRPLVYTEAYVKAGEYYSFVNKREKKYTMSTGTVLGNTVEESVEKLHKPQLAQDYETLRDLVEKKWIE